MGGLGALQSESCPTVCRAYGLCSFSTTFAWGGVKLEGAVRKQRKAAKKESHRRRHVIVGGCSQQKASTQYLLREHDDIGQRDDAVGRVEERVVCDLVGVEHVQEVGERGACGLVGICQNPSEVHMKFR